MTIEYDAIRLLRTNIRWHEHHSMWTDWDRGGCLWVSEALSDQYGWSLVGGCYVVGDKHYAHYWNLLPDGRLLDATADQWNDGDDIRVTSTDDPRYDATCGCGKDG